jgi:predicted dehydrogenase
MSTASGKIAVGIAGFGKIASTEHSIALAASSSFSLHSIADPIARAASVACFPDVEQMLAADGAPEVVAVCTPPQIRYRVAQHALRRGRHVLLEKPPAATAGEVEALEQLARRHGRTLFCAWHSRFAPAVAPARQWLSLRRVRRVRIEWREDVRDWHPGQQWIWKPGGFGVFDPGVNALSVATELLPQAFFLSDAVLHYPENCETPIAASLTFSDIDALEMTAAFDWLHTGQPQREIEIETDDGGQLQLSDSGRRLTINGTEIPLGPQEEYRELYLHLHRLIADARCDADIRPLRLVIDALARGRKEKGAPFRE